MTLLKENPWDASGALHRERVTEDGESHAVTECKNCQECDVIIVFIISVKSN